MFGAGLAVLVSTALGALLALPRGGLRRFSPAIQTFALSAGVAVILLHLLPAALDGLGVYALLLLLVGLSLPSLLSRALGRGALGDHAADDRLSLELGYGGLLLHKLGDGLAMGTFHTGAHAGHSHLGLSLALGAHAIPVTALVVLAFTRRTGVRAGLRRAAGMAAAGLAGIGLPWLVPAALVTQVEPYVAGLTAGLLLHVIAHDWQGEIPRNTFTRFGDLLALLLGVTLSAIGGHAHEDGAEHLGVQDQLAHAFVDLLYETAPSLLLGLGIGAVLQTFGTRIPAGFMRRGGSVTQAVKGSLLGAPLPVCACGVLPIADSLRRRKAPAALVIAFLLATPELGAETLVLTARFMGWPFAMYRLGAAVAVAILAALLVARTQARREGETLLGDEPLDAGDHAPGGWLARTVGYFDELLYHTGPWTLVGLFAAACVQVALPEGALGSWAGHGVDVLVVSLVAIPSYVCAAAATPLGAVLLAKGFSQGAVLAGLLLGPATNVATLAFLRRVYGGAAAWWLVGGVLLATWSLAAVLNLGAVPLTLAVGQGEAHGEGWLSLAATGLLAALVLRAIWRDGVRAWLSALGEAVSSTHASGGHGHGHDHGHGHGHGHDHGHGHGH